MAVSFCSIPHGLIIEWCLHQLEGKPLWWLLSWKQVALKWWKVQKGQGQRGNSTYAPHWLPYFKHFNPLDKQTHFRNKKYHKSRHLASVCKLKNVFAAFTRDKEYWETAMNIARLLRKAMGNYKERKQWRMKIKYL